MNNSNITKIITHSGTFHADDVFACATLSILLNGNVEFIRTRDEEIIKTGEYVVDVGGIYDANKNLFDHHQKEGAGEHPNGIPYASFGLVWKKFGEELCGSKEIAEKIDESIAQAIDAEDSGIEISKSLFENISHYSFDRTFGLFVPTWKESEHGEKNVDDEFIKVVHFAKDIIQREIIRRQHKKEAEKYIIEAYEHATDKRIVELKRYLPWKSALEDLEEPLFVISPREQDKWQIEANRIKGEVFKRRKYFPESWAGLQNEKLAEVTGVADAIFCHRDRFIVVAGSREGVLRLAQLAVEN